MEESPPTSPFPENASRAELSSHPQDLFSNLANCNVGFNTYHPTPVTQAGSKLAGRGDMGGVWEWTSTILEKHEGFEAMKSYPGYTGFYHVGD